MKPAVAVRRVVRPAVLIAKNARGGRAGGMPLRYRRDGRGGGAGRKGAVAGRGQMAAAGWATLEVACRVEVAWKLGLKKAAQQRKILIDEICRFNIPVYQMANEPAIDTVILSFQIPAADKLRLKKEAKARKMEGISTLARFLISEAVKDVALTPEDYEEIAKIIRQNQQRRNKKRTS